MHMYIEYQTISNAVADASFAGQHGTRCCKGVPLTSGGYMLPFTA